MYFFPGELACVELLICKTAPVLRKMQSSIEDRILGREPAPENKLNKGKQNFIEETFMRQLPSMEELREFGHECEKRYPECDLNSIE